MVTGVLQRDLDAARRELTIYKGGGVPPPSIAGEDGIVFDSVAYAQLRVEYDDLKSRFDDEVQGIKDVSPFRSLRLLVIGTPFLTDCGCDYRRIPACRRRGRSCMIARMA